MKKALLTITALLLVLFSINAYSLDHFNYKGIALNDVGQILPSTVVNVQITISSITGGVLYKETHNGVTTDQFGGFVVEVGTGTVVSGALGGITTTADTRIKAETNVGGGAWVLSTTETLSEAMKNALNDITDFAWGLEGNAGTTAGTNFIGTTDNVDLVFKTDGVEAMRIKNDGKVGIGTNPSEKFAVKVHPSTDFPELRYMSIGSGGGGWGFGLSSFMFIDETAIPTHNLLSGFFTVQVEGFNSAAIIPNTLRGVQGQITHKGLGTVTEARGVEGAIGNLEGGTITDAYGGYFLIKNPGSFSSGNIENAHSVFVKNDNSSMTNKTGVTIEEMTGATHNTDLLIGTNTIPASDNYAIYSASTRPSYFAGPVNFADGFGGWELTGNAGTTAGTNFIGTTDNTPLEFRVENSGTVKNSLILNANGSIQHDNPSVGGSYVAGDARGINAVDLQSNREHNNSVASGDYSVVGGGSDNRALHDYSTVSGGYSNYANGDYATAAGGRLSGASGDYAMVGGGNFCHASGDYSAVICGDNTVASGNYSIAGGGFALADKYGQNAYGSGRFSENGDAQTSVFVVRNTTTNTTPTVLYLDGTAASEKMTLNDGDYWVFRALVVGGDDNHSIWGSYVVTGFIQRTGGIITIQGVTTTVISEVNPSYDATANIGLPWGLSIVVTGDASNTMRWVARVEVTQLNY